MKKDPVTMSLLYDYYGGVLTEKQSEVYDAYHNADLNLSEIAENLSITRQGVHDLLSRAEQSLFTLESKLGFVSRFTQQKEKADDILALLTDMEQLNTRALSSPQLERHLQQVRALVQELVGN